MGNYHSNSSYPSNRAFQQIYDTPSIVDTSLSIAYREGQSITLETLPPEILHRIAHYLILSHWEYQGDGSEYVIRIQNLLFDLFGEEFRDHESIDDCFWPENDERVDDSEDPDCNPLVPTRGCKELFAATVNEMLFATILYVNTQYIVDMVDEDSLIWGSERRHKRFRFENVLKHAAYLEIYVEVGPSEYSGARMLQSSKGFEEHSLWLLSKTSADVGTCPQTNKVKRRLVNLSQDSDPLAGTNLTGVCAFYVASYTADLKRHGA